MSNHNFQVGDEVVLGVIDGDLPLDAIVVGEYGEYVVIRFKSDGFYLRRSQGNIEVSTDDAQWFLSMMIVHPDNLRYRTHGDKAGK